ncbi:MAG: hypothetical protein Q8L26_06080 [Candidatus Omnitrophota bacterium]|nr:hypothetical protein [Candidatus Omnitrophota bacterium]
MPKNRNIVIHLLYTAFQLLKKHPVALFPLAITAFLELIALEIIYFLPRWPLNILFAPIVRTLWGEQFLHYPANFILMYRLIYYAQVLIYIGIGGFLIAVTCSLVYDTNSDKTPHLKTAFRKNSKKYIDIFCIALIITVCLLTLRKGYDFTLKSIISSQIYAANHIVIALKKWLIHSSNYVNFILGILTDTAFAYCIPLIIIKNKKILAALKDNFKALKNNFIATFLFVLVPSLSALPLIYLNNNASALMDKICPEIVPLMIILGVILSLFINGYVISLITLYYLQKCQKE